MEGFELTEILKALELETIGSVIALTWLLVGALGKASKELGKHQEITAVVVAVILVGIAKGTGIGLVDYDWVGALLAAVLAAFGSGIAHDKLAKPGSKTWRDVLAYYRDFIRDTVRK